MLISIYLYLCNGSGLLYLATKMKSLGWNTSIAKCNQVSIRRPNTINQFYFNYFMCMATNRSYDM